MLRIDIKKIGIMAIRSNTKARAKLDKAISNITPRRVVRMYTYESVPIRAGRRSEKKFLTIVTRNIVIPGTLTPDTFNNNRYRQVLKKVCPKDRMKKQRRGVVSIPLIVSMISFKDTFLNRYPIIPTVTNIENMA